MLRAFGNVSVFAALGLQSLAPQVTWMIMESWRVTADSMAEPHIIIELLSIASLDTQEHNSKQMKGLGGCEEVREALTANREDFSL